ncbi:acyloxyacyl hydrolase [Ensifer adhaerens]|uniref:acyloxyacyl hydrolase n=1 Tax=Ensifer adhaerens TaxID=106592 RepID=UPI003CFCA86E
MKIEVVRVTFGQALARYDFGCRLHFRENAAAGVRLDEHWNVSASVEHTSHANLCDGPNNGLTRAGLALGYKF